MAKINKCRPKIVITRWCIGGFSVISGRLTRFYSIHTFLLQFVTFTLFKLEKTRYMYLYNNFESPFLYLKLN